MRFRKIAYYQKFFVKNRERPITENGVKLIDMVYLKRTLTGMKETNKITIRHIKKSDKEFWVSLDKHLTALEFEKKVRDRQAYILSIDNQSVGILRYNLFWDNTPFCTLLYIDEKFQRNGYGKALMNFWEKEMQSLGYDWLLVSTRSDENAQHFYRALGYQDCGCLIAPDQPMELFLGKHIENSF